MSADGRQRRLGGYTGDEVCRYEYVDVRGSRQLTLAEALSDDG